MQLLSLWLCIYLTEGHANGVIIRLLPKHFLRREICITIGPIMLGTAATLAQIEVTKSLTVRMLAYVITVSCATRIICSRYLHTTQNLVG